MSTVQQLREAVPWTRLRAICGATATVSSQTPFSLGKDTPEPRPIQPTEGALSLFEILRSAFRCRAAPTGPPHRNAPARAVGESGSQASQESDARSVAYAGARIASVVADAHGDEVVKQVSADLPLEVVHRQGRFPMCFSDRIRAARRTGRIGPSPCGSYLFSRALPTAMEALLLPECFSLWLLVNRRDPSHYAHSDKRGRRCIYNPTSCTPSSIAVASGRPRYSSCRSAPLRYSGRESQPAFP